MALLTGSGTYFLSLNLTSIGMLLPWRKVCPLSSLIALRADSLILNLICAYHFPSSMLISSISPINENTSCSDSDVAFLGKDLMNSL